MGTVGCLEPHHLDPDQAPPISLNGTSCARTRREVMLRRMAWLGSSADVWRGRWLGAADILAPDGNVRRPTSERQLRVPRYPFGDRLATQLSGATGIRRRQMRPAAPWRPGILARAMNSLRVVRGSDALRDASGLGRHVSTRFAEGATNVQSASVCARESQRLAARPVGTLAAADVPCVKRLTVYPESIHGRQAGEMPLMGPTIFKVHRRKFISFISAPTASPMQWRLD